MQTKLGNSAQHVPLVTVHGLAPSLPLLHCCGILDAFLMHLYSSTKIDPAILGNKDMKVEDFIDLTKKYAMGIIPSNMLSQGEDDGIEGKPPEDMPLRQKVKL